jgi:type I restriction enzyme, S subunit
VAQRLRRLTELRLSAEDYLSPGDLLICRTNGSIGLIGKSAVVHSLPEPTYFASYLLRFRFVNSVLSSEWVHIVLESPQGRRYIEAKAASSAGQHNINLKTLHGLSIPLPALAEQYRIVAEMERRLSVLEALESTVDHGLKRAERLRQSILKRALEGRLVPQDPHDEPASVLLERIRAERGAQRHVGVRRKVTVEAKTRTNFGISDG